MRLNGGYRVNKNRIKEYRLALIDGGPGQVFVTFWRRADDLAIEDAAKFLKETAIRHDAAFLYREKDFYPIYTFRR